MLLRASLSKVHCNRGLLTIGKSILGLVQLNGLSLVPKPPARITALKDFTALDRRFICDPLAIKQFGEGGKS
jgi:hypothetical protein